MDLQLLWILCDRNAAKNFVLKSAILKGTLQIKNT